MKGKSGKICEINDPEKLREVILKEKGGEMSCSICCAVSHSEDNLCSPVKKPGANIFCDL